MFEQNPTCAGMYRRRLGPVHHLTGPVTTDTLRLTAGEPPLASTTSAGVLRVVAVAALTAFASWFGSTFVRFGPDTTPVVSLAAGVALAGILLGGSRLWPGIVVGVFAAELGGSAAAGLSSSGVVAALAIAFAAALQAVVSAALFRAVVGASDPFHRARDGGWFVVIGTILGCVIMPTVTATADGVSGVMPWNQWS
jgi:integral membrane sensor domain MASE1